MIFIAFMVILRHLVISKQNQLGVSAGHLTKDLYYKLQIDRATFSRGEPIRVQLSVKNISDKPVTLKFDTTLEFDFVIQRELNMLFVDVPLDVWKYSAKSVPAPRPHVVTIPPGQEKVFTAMWDQRDSSGNPVKPGRYIITGTLNAVDRMESLRVRGETQ
ncbi:MAG: BsuPI-related putative proteinase inhibitor [Candidatus Eremiobacterota bacterium]